MVVLSNRIRSWLLVLVAVLAISAKANEPPQFTNCIPSLTKTHCEPFSHDFDAIDTDGDTNLVFTLMNGVGSIDPKTGIYTANGVQVGSHFVTVGVTDIQSSGETTTCEFEIVATNVGPTIGCIDTPILAPIGLASVQRVLTSDDCGLPAFFIADSGNVSGTILLNRYGGHLTYVPATEDRALQQPVTMKIGVSDGYDTAYCFVKWSVTLPGYQISLPTTGAPLNGHTKTIELMMDKFDSTRGISGFDILLAWQYKGFSVSSIQPGDIFSECAWEYFTWRHEPLPDFSWGCNQQCPVDLVRIVGLEWIAHNNDCDLQSKLPISLARIDVAFSYVEETHCDFSLDFYWKSCDDNLVLPRHQRDTPIGPLYSRHVYYGDNAHWPVEPDSKLPTFYGAPAACVESTFTSPAESRMVDYYGGWMDVVCSEPSDVIGDINLNGLSYESADYVMLRDYFTQGPSAFASHRNGSSAASDVNHDGMTLSLPDLISLYRITKKIIYPPVGFDVSLHPTYVTYNQSTGLATFNSADTLGAIWLEFADTIPVTVAGPAGVTSWGHHDSVTWVLVAPVDTNYPAFAGQVDLQINPKLHVIAAAATTFDGKVVPTIFSSISDVDDGPNNALPSALEVFQNYPNPFNLSTTIRLALPIACEVKLEIINVLGETVYEASERFSAGDHTMQWNGHSQSGRLVSSGVYYARLTAGKNSAVRKMVLLK